MRRLGLTASFFAFGTIVGCYASHTRPTDAGAALDASGDLLDGFHADAPADASTHACSTDMLPGCAADEQLLVVDRVACRWGGPECVTLDLTGGPIEPPLCVMGAPPTGRRVRIVRCAADSWGASLRLTAISAPDPSGSTGWALEDPRSCECRQTTSGFFVGDVQEVPLPSAPSPLGDAISLEGETVLYHLEVCAWGDCS